MPQNEKLWGLQPGFLIGELSLEIQWGLGENHSSMSYLRKNIQAPHQQER